MDEQQARSIAQRIAREAIQAELEEGNWTTVDGEPECFDRDEVLLVEKHLQRIADMLRPPPQKPVCGNCGSAHFRIVSNVETQKHYIVKEAGFAQQPYPEYVDPLPVCECVQCDAPYPQEVLENWIGYWENKKRELEREEEH